MLIIAKISSVIIFIQRFPKRNDKDSIVKSFEKLVAKGKVSEEDTAKILSKIATGGKEFAKEAAFLVEAVAEDLSVKKGIV